MSDNNQDHVIGMDSRGYDVLTKATLELINDYPGLDEYYGEPVAFESLKENGLTFSADNGALIMTERRSITDYVRQTCTFPIYIVFRASAKERGAKLRIQTFLDSLGKWLCGEPTPEGYEPAVYPELSEGRKITRITRYNSFGVEPNADGTQDWLLPVTIQYTNEFQL